jgi:DNA-binding transcriptional regulator YbjK
VARVTNFGDPSFEPTDEELAELMHEAFAEVPARNAEALARIHSEVARLREEAMAWLEQRRGAVK